KPKIADYPFTTLHPNLGVARIGSQKDFVEMVFADIPGLIEGAHEGQGLGDRFLGHIERTRVIVHLIDIYQDDIVKAYKTIRNELKQYGGGLVDKSEIVALNKCDTMSLDEANDYAALFEKE